MRLFHVRISGPIESVSREALWNDLLYPCLTLTPKATIFSVMVKQIKNNMSWDWIAKIVPLFWKIILLSHLCLLFLNWLFDTSWVDHLTRTNSLHSRTKMVFLLAPWQDQIHQELLCVKFVIVQLILMCILSLKWWYLKKSSFGRLFSQFGRIF